MAFWVVGGGSSLEGTGPATLFDGGNIKRRFEGLDFGDEPDPNEYSKRPRFNDWSDTRYRESPSSNSIQVKNLAFLVIRERSPTPEYPSSTNNGARPLSAPATATNTRLAVNRLPHSMERTASGLSISSDNTTHHNSLHEKESMLADLEAARLVKKHVSIYRRRNPDSRNQRILKTLINPRSREADFPLDNDALRSIFSAANELFFANRLSQRVAWDWSHPASAQYESHIVGTTALRKSAQLGGYETLIVLSSPILRDTKYNRRLLISTFLHEMIHSFLFVTTGLKATECGGHTEGFRQIAEIIDDWVGKDYLRLSNMDADLEHFREVCSTSSIVGEGARYPYQDSPCTGHAQEPSQEHPQLYNESMFGVPTPIRNAERDGWQWYEQEGFLAREARPADQSYG